MKTENQWLDECRAKVNLFQSEQDKKIEFNAHKINSLFRIIEQQNEEINSLKYKLDRLQIKLNKGYKVLNI